MLMYSLAFAKFSSRIVSSRAAEKRKTAGAAHCRVSLLSGYTSPCLYLHLSRRTPRSLLDLLERQASLEKGVFETVEDESSGLVFVACS